MANNAKIVLAHRRIAVQKAQFRAAEGLRRIKQVASGSLRRSTPKNPLLRSAFRDGRLHVIARSKLENGKSAEELPTKADTERTVELLRMEINAQSPQQQFHSVTVGVLIDRFLHLGAHEYDTTEKPHGFNAGVALQASLLAMLRVGWTELASAQTLMTTTTNGAHAEGSPTSPRGRQTLPWSLGYLVLALACLIQWRSSSPWSRLDVFSGVYLALRALPTLRSLLAWRRVRVSAECQRERWGSTSAPGWVRWTVVLMVADLAVFLDYGHWHLVPGLERHTAQTCGLVMYFAVTVWQKWTDRHLDRAFAGQTLRPRLTQSGPFGYVRHPRYAGALAGKVAAALVFASALGWLQAALWSVLLLRQIRLEEVHLRGLFGREYEEYSQHTARLVPGIF